MTEPMYLGSFDSEKWLDILGFNGFQTCALCHEVSHPELFAKKKTFFRLFMGKYSFSRYSRFMSTDEDRNKERFKNWKHCELWNLLFSPDSNKAHAELRLLSEFVYQSLCSAFCNSWISPQIAKVLRNTIVFFVTLMISSGLPDPVFKNKKIPIPFNCNLSQKLHWKYTSHWAIWALTKLLYSNIIRFLMKSK